MALIKHNHANTTEMEEIGGYEILCYLLRSKKFMLDDKYISFSTVITKRPPVDISFLCFCRIMDVILDLVGMAGVDRYVIPLCSL